MRRLFIAALAAISLVLPAHAQDHFFPTPGNANVGGQVIMCLNGSGQAVPATAAGTCLGAGGGGGGGAVTVANGADTAQGSTTDAPCTLPATTTACTLDALSKAIANSVSSAIPAGTAIIGRVGIDQTTPGTTNGVQLNAALPAGTNSIGTTQLPVNVTLTDCSATVVTGGTAVNAFTAQTTLHGFTILNDDITEVMWISFTTTAAAGTAGSYPLAPATATTFAGANSFTSPPGMGTNHALSVVAATSAHKFSCTWW